MRYIVTTTGQYQSGKAITSVIGSFESRNKAEFALKSAFYYALRKCGIFSDEGENLWCNKDRFLVRDVDDTFEVIGDIHEIDEEEILLDDVIML